ncbi:vegetative incompatibility het-e-1 [Fusarium acutatum]|uniref:Vegetative incompatibility het-e-1 n=1 Tax=Fusarium acutatum TaxID=78861 RepID=A0A8H4JSC0_9HYPO|nr:vegetative incompatibility het-e-1 [Fusarium acutatum]
MKRVSSLVKSVFAAKDRSSPRQSQNHGTRGLSSEPSNLYGGHTPEPTRTLDNPALLAPTPEAGLENGDFTSQALAAISDNARSLWDRSYDSLREKDKQLIKDYEKLLSKELQPELDVTSLNTSESESYIDRTDHRHRQQQLALIIRNGLKRAEEGKTTYTIFGKTFVPREQAARTAEFVKSIKILVDEAVKSSTEASLAWAGICTVLPILVNPFTAETAQQNGFIYVTARMRFYVELEHHLWPASLEAAIELRQELENDLLDLYQQILEFQIKLVIYLYKTRLAKWRDDVTNHDIWNGMVSAIKELESTFDKDLKKINDISSRLELEKLNKKAEMFFDALISKLPTSLDTTQSRPPRGLVYAGYGDQFNAFGGAMQYNNTGSGDQYAGVRIQGSTGVGGM